MAMDLHRLVLFSHLAAMIGLFAALALEGVSLTSLRRCTSYEQAREWTGLWSLLVPLAVPSLLVVLGSGIYLATTFGLWELGWTKAAIPTLVIVAVAGGIIRPRRNRSRAAVATGAGPLAPAVRIELQHPLFLASWRFRATLLVGLVFDMTAKPDLSGVLLISVAVLIGIGVSIPAWFESVRASGPDRRGMLTVDMEREGE